MLIQFFKTCVESNIDNSVVKWFLLQAQSSIFIFYYIENIGNVLGGLKCSSEQQYAVASEDYLKKQNIKRKR